MAIRKLRKDPPAQSKYRADIDGLRAVAVLAIVGFHAFPEWVTGGFVGVDVFFVISGFLISGLIFHGLQDGTFSYAHFYGRRIKRIFPALIVVLLGIYSFGLLVLTGAEFRQLGSHIAAGAGFLSNFMLWRESGYFDNLAETKPLLHLWSLGIEEQFYIVWPLLLGWSHKRQWNCLAITGLIAIISFALNLCILQDHPVAAFYSPISRFWELMLGGILAYVTPNRRAGGFGRHSWYSILGLALIASSIALLDKDRAFPGWWALLPCAGAFLVIAAGPDGWVNRNLLSRPVLVQIGLISYPLYLWHWPLLSFAYIMESQAPSYEVRGALVLISLILAGVTYEKLEIPARFGRSKQTVPVLCLLMVSIGCLGYDASRQVISDNIVFNTLFRSLEVPSANEHAEDMRALRNYQSLIGSQTGYLEKLFKQRQAAIRILTCHWKEWESFEQYKREIGNCLTLSSSKKNVLIVGDSHAAEMYPALAETHPQYNFLQLTGALCTPISRSYSTPSPCAQLIEYAISFAMRTRLDAVILEARWPEGYKGLALDLDRWKARGRKIILVGPPLEYSASVSKIIARWYGNDDFRRYTDSFILKAPVALSNEMRSFARVNSIAFIDRIQYFSEGGFPVINANGQLLFTDYGHLSLPGSIFLGGQLLKDDALQRIIDSPVPLQLPEEDSSLSGLREINAGAK
jgi:peptidoglycan/LPS O-acetylase OafA/YrhL